MSIEFIRERIGSAELAKARKQQKQLRFFTKSSVQDDITIEYLNQWAMRKYAVNEDFLNWVKTIFREDNFLTFYKYYRTPGPSSGLINDIIKPALSRVFYSDDSYFHYTVRGERVDEPEYLECDEFNKKMFNALLFRFNDILIHDLKDVNKPHRFLIDIDDVIALDSHESEIKRIAYSSCFEDENGNKIFGYTYMDDKVYAFYDKDVDREEPIYMVEHDLGECPADYIPEEAFNDEDIVRQGLFSHVKEKIEEYDFLKTLQKLTEPNQAFPVIATFKSQDGKSKDEDFQDDDSDFPLSTGKVPKTKGSPTQAGGIAEVSITDLKDDEGRINMDILKNMFTYFHAPVEVLEFMNKRVTQIHNDIIVQLLGDFKQKNEDARNELDVKSGYVSMEDRLRIVSSQLSRISNRSNYKMLALAYGKDNVSVDNFFGSDFFLATESELYDMFSLSPNVLERKHILKKLTSTRNKFNPEKAKRDKILYDLIPFISDKDFNASIDRIDNTTFLYQTRFEYWIAKFESEFGDIVEFWDGLKDDSITKSYQNSEIINLINNFIIKFIKDYEQSSETINDNASGSEGE